jgi:hypothetical protein
MNCKECGIDRTMYEYLLTNLWKDNPEMLQFVKDNIAKANASRNKNEMDIS